MTCLKRGSVTADKSYLRHSFLVYIQSLTNSSGRRFFGSVVEQWIIDPAARVLFPSKSWDFVTLICYVLVFVTAFMTSDRGLSGIGLNFLPNWLNSAPKWHFDIVSKYNVGLKTLFLEGLSEPEFYGNWVYKFRKIIGKK